MALQKETKPQIRTESGPSVTYPIPRVLIDTYSFKIEKRLHITALTQQRQKYQHTVTYAIRKQDLTSEKRVFSHLIDDDTFRRRAEETASAPSRQSVTQLLPVELKVEQPNEVANCEVFTRIQAHLLQTLKELRLTSEQRFSSLLTDADPGTDRGVRAERTEAHSGNRSTRLQTEQSMK